MKEQLCTIRIVVNVSSDDEAIEIKKKIEEAIEGTDKAQVHFALMPNLSKAANGWRGSLNSEYNQALSDWQGGDDHAALQDVIQGMSHTVQFMLNILNGGFFGWNGATWCLISILDRDSANPFITADDVPALDMAGIINAMLAATPEEVEYFVGLSDAFRQSIWNRPFNKEFFASLARGFMQWE
jgi:hypothetical protein